MAQQRILLGHVKGDQGEPGKNGENGKNGIDAKITSATGTVTPGHLDEPTVSIEFGGEPGAQTATFSFAGLQGRDGAPGKDGAAATIGTITAEVDDSTGTPEVSVSTEGGYDKDLKFSFRNLKGAPGEDGAAGANGRDAGISAVDVTVEPGHSDSPSATARVSGDPGAQTISLTFTGLQGAAGERGADGATGAAGPAGPAGEDFKPGGTSSQLVLGDGTTVDISTFITDNAEAIRTAIGLATTDRMGLVPQLPQAEG